jgi:cytosine/adenosine deaminase-related metal-dependent hydrolase
VATDTTTLSLERYLIAPELLLDDMTPRSGWAAVVDGGRFTAVGPRARLQGAHPELPVVTAPGRLLMPGLVDAHHHLTQAFGTAYAFGEPSEIFRRVWVPLEGALTEEEVYVSAQLAALESLRGGFTTVADAGTRSAPGPRPIAEATAELGLRCVLAVACTDGADALSPDQAWDRASRHLDAVSGRDLVHGSVAVPVPESVSEPTLKALVELCRERQVPLQVHVNEHLVGVERSLVTRGRRPLEYLDDAGAVGPWLLAAHTTLLTPEEALLLRDRGAAVSYNPVATFWKGNAVAPATLLAALGVRMGLGTDGTRGDAFRLLDAAETAQRLGSAMAVGDPYAGRGRRWLRAGTQGGADALGLGAVVGRIAPGLAADYLLVDLDVPELVSTRDVVWELVRRGNRDLIEVVAVAGRPRLVDGWPSDFDREAFLRRSRRLATAAVTRAGLSGGPE